MLARLPGLAGEEITQGVVAQGADTVRGQIFAGMAGAFLPEKGGSQGAVVQYDINGGGTVHTYQLKIAAGKCELVKGAAGPARVILALQVPDFLRLVTGKLNGMQAFMTGKLKLTGDMMFAQVMQGWFEQ